MVNPVRGFLQKNFIKIFLFQLNGIPQNNNKVV